MKRMLALVLTTACATGAGDDGDDTAGAGGTASSSSSASSSATSSTSVGGAGPECSPPEHLCGGICAGNTPETGCYQSTECMPCPSDPNGTATCSADGLCDLECTAPFIEVGSACACPTECCGPADCDSDELCEMGACKINCMMGTQNYAACLLLCDLQDMTCDEATCTCI